jgi:hypothetical protein
LPASCCSLPGVARQFDKRRGKNMRLACKPLGLVCVVFFTSLAAGRAQSADGPQRTNQLPAARTADLPAYPLVIRIDHSAFEALANSKATERRPVDTVVLGTRAVGESGTQGAISVLLVPDRNDASFDVIFQGRTHTRTVGTHGPALIYSHTDTDFVCTRSITFHARQGFVADASNVVAHTNMVYDGFDSSRCLGRRLVSRIARRRAGKSREQARAIAARINEDALLAGFDKQLNPQLDAMNQKLGLIAYVNLFMGEAPVQLAAQSSKDCIHIGIGKEGSAARLTVIPPRRDLAAPLEILVHRSLLGEPVAKLVQLVEDTVLPEPLRLQILGVLGISAQEAARIKDIAIYDDWFVIGLQIAQVATVTSPPTPNVQPAAVTAP